MYSNVQYVLCGLCISCICLCFRTPFQLPLSTVYIFLFFNFLHSHWNPSFTLHHSKTHICDADISILVDCVVIIGQSHNSVEEPAGTLSLSHVCRCCNCDAFGLRGQRGRCGLHTSLLLNWNKVIRETCRKWAFAWQNDSPRAFTTNPAGRFANICSHSCIFKDAV